MAIFNKESSAGRIASEIYEKRLAVTETMRDNLAQDLAGYFRKYGKFPGVENDQDVMSFIIGRPELRRAFGALDLNRESTIKLFKEAIDIAQSKVQNIE